MRKLVMALLVAGFMSVAVVGCGDKKKDDAKPAKKDKDAKPAEKEGEAKE